MSFLPSRFYLGDFLDDVVKDDTFSTMKSDIYKEDNKYHVEMDMPGFNKQDISINCENGYLTIEAEKNSESEDKNKNYIRRERTYGKIKREFYIGEAKEDEIKAELKDGVLKVLVPLKEKKELKRKIEIE